MADNARDKMGSGKNDTDVLSDKSRPQSNEMRDEMSPDNGQPMQQRKTGGDQMDTAGEHGDMAPETAKILADKADQNSS